MIENYDAVIFDFDGTLYDYKNIPRNLVLNSPRNIFCIKAVSDARNKLKGIDFGNTEKFGEAYVAEVSRLARISKGKAAEWCFTAGPANMIDVLRKKYRMRESAPQVFGAFGAAGVKTAVFSDYAFVKERMAAIGFPENTCGNLFSAEELGALKPCPRPLLDIAAALGVKPERCLIVGDRNDTDGEGARKAGMKFIQIITCKTHTADFADGHPVIVWDDFARSVLN